MGRPIDFGEIKVVSWDIDGTMYNLERLIKAFKRDLFRRMLSPGWFRAWVDFFRLLRFKRFMDRVRARGGSFHVPPVPKRLLVAETQDEMYGRILPEVGALPGVLALMEWFKEQGIIQVAFSDYLPSTKLTALGVEGYLSAVYAGETLGYLKPGTGSFRAILAAQEIQPKQLLHIGDRLDTDGAAAPEVGYQVAIIGHDYDSITSLHKALMGQ